MDEAKIIEMIRAGQVPATSQICAEGDQTWKPLNSHGAFANAATAPAGASPGAGSPAAGSPAAAQTAGVAPTMAMSAVDASKLGLHAAAATPAPSAVSPAPGGPAASPGFGAGANPSSGSTPGLGSTAASGSAAGFESAPAGGPASAPGFGSSPGATGVPGFGGSPPAASGSAPGFGTPAGSASGGAPGFGATSSAPGVGSAPGAGSAPGFGAAPAAGSAPGFGPGSPVGPASPVGPGSPGALPPAGSSTPGAVAPPGAQALGGPAPTATPSAADGKKSKLPLIIGAGCGALLLFGLCIGGGVGAWLIANSDPFPGQVNRTAEIVRDVAIEANHEDAVEWVSPVDQDLQDRDQDMINAVAPLGDEAEIVAVAVGLNAWNPTTQLTATAIVFPNGDVAYANIRSRPNTNGLTQTLLDALAWPDEVEDERADLLTGVDTLLEALDENPCEVDWVERGQLEGLPPTLVDDIVGDVSDQNLRDACAQVTSTEGWSRAVVSLTLIIEGNGQYGLLRTRFRRDQNGVIYLSPIDGSLWDR